MRDSQSRKRIVRLLHVDTTQLDLSHEFELSSVQPPDDGNSDETTFEVPDTRAGNSGEAIFEVKPLERPSQDMEVISVKKIMLVKSLSTFEHCVLIVALQAAVYVWFP